MEKSTAAGSNSGMSSTVERARVSSTTVLAPRAVTIAKVTKAKTMPMRMMAVYVARGTVFLGSRDSSP